MSGASGEVNPGQSPQSRRGAWGTGPKVLTWIGAVVVGIALIAGGFGAWAFTSMIPVGVVTAQATPGPKAMGGAEIPGEVTIDVVGGQRVVIWEAVSTSSTYSLHRSDISVRGSAGEVSVRSPSVSGTTIVGATHARTVAEFLVPGDDIYTVAVEGTGGGHFVVAEGDSFPAFFSGLFGTILLWFVAIGGGIVGVGLLVPGIAWGMIRARRPAVP